jgi:nucleotide-binding universal stress UspA family protein
MRVFFAVDGSADASRAVTDVGQLLSPRTDLAAFYFAPPEVHVRHAHDAAVMRERARRAIADAVFNDVRPLLPPELGASATTITCEHTPCEGILLEAEKWNADLIVVGARGLTQIDKWVLGSVADSVATKSKLPVLVSRPRPEERAGRPLRILYAYDGSQCCTAALRLCEKFSYPEGTQVTALTVVEAMTVGNVPQWILDKARDADTEAMSSAWQREFDEDKRQAHDDLAAFMAKQPAPFDKAETIVAEGHAAEQILRVAAEREVDGIVMGARGHGMLARMFIGSTSDRVLNHATCSVLIVHGQ